MLPAWCDQNSPVFDFEIPTETPSNNVIKEMHWATYKNLRRMWRIKVFSRALGGRKPTQCIRRAALVIERHCAGELDWDNAYGGLKPLLDCLVKASKPNPDGLGLIENDSPKNMPYPPLLFQLPAKRGEGRTRVMIFDLEKSF